MTRSAPSAACDNSRDPDCQVQDGSPGGDRGVCPVCLFLAHIRPDPDDGMAVACDRCGTFGITGGAQDALATHAGPLDRARLSQATCDACMLAECDQPLIDRVAAAALIGLATG